MIPEIEKNLAELLESEFPNGIRPSDFIDQRKLRKFYKAYFETDLPSDFNFQKVLPHVGVVHDGKVFPRPSSKNGGWRKLLNALVAQGHALFRFSRVMELHAADLLRLGVASEGILRELVRTEAADAFEVNGDFFSVKGQSTADILPCEGLFAEEKSIARDLPYAGEDFVHDSLRNDARLLRNVQGVYAILDRIAFDEDEVARGRRDCISSIAKDGFFSLGQLELENSAAMNDRRLAEGTLRRAFFLRFLAKDHDLKGLIVCPKGEEADSRLPLRLFCREHAEVTLGQIGAIADECNLAGWFAITTAHEEMVRVDRDRFVSPNLVTFDTEATDDAIAAHCAGEATPLGAFSGFPEFPAVPGFAWNDFLLESFLRRSSQRFRLFMASAAAKDASGAVAEKAASFADAPDAFAAAALSAGIEPDPDAVGDFLVASRCALRRGRELVTAVVAAMHSRERSRK